MSSSDQSFLTRRTGAVIALAALLAAVSVTAYPLAPARTQAPSAVTLLRSGPWGVVSARRMIIAPPRHQEHADDFADRAVWRFARTTRDELVALFAETNLTNEQLAELFHGIRADANQHGYILLPSDEVVQALDPASRARVYHRLAQDPRNVDQVNAFRFWGESPAQWLAQARLPEHARAVVEPLIYRNGSYLFFADRRLAFKAITDPVEQRHLEHALMGEAALMLRLHVMAGQDIEPLVAYWGAASRAKDVRTLLQSLADTPGGGSIDIVHLLPPFARARLYTYPGQSAALPPGHMRDCHWSALNFFNHEADDRFADDTYVSMALDQEYVPVSEPALGDLVVFTHEHEIYHTAVFIADDVVFTKNGARTCRPWMLLPLDAMGDFYPVTGTYEVRFLRRIANDAGSAAPGAM